METREVELIDKKELKSFIRHQAYIGGEERLLSKEEIEFLIDNSRVYDIQTVKRF